MDHKNLAVSPSRSNVLAKVIDGEAILINVSTGAYYSLSGIGGLVWQWIENEKSLQEMVSAITRNYDVEAETALMDTRHLIETMVAEGIVTSVGTDALEDETVSAVSISKKELYHPPTIEIYRDMQDLLALDPPMPGLRTIPRETSD